MDPVTLVVMLCLGGVVLLVLLSIFSGLLEFIFSILGFVLDLFFGGPVAWCGCLVVLILLGIVAFAIFSAAGIFAPL